MKPRTTLMLMAVLLVLCAGYAWFIQAGKREEVRRQEAMRVYDFDPDTVQRLTVEQVGRPAVTAMRKEDGTWTIQEPRPGIPPLDLMWNRVAHHLSQLKNHRTIAEAPEGLARFGLAEPALRVAADLSGHAPVEVIFGDTEPTERFRYAQVDGGPVILVDSTQYFELNRSLDDLRMRFLMDNHKASLLRIEFSPIYTGEGSEAFQGKAPEIGTLGQRVVVEREAAGKPWRILEPRDMPANQKVLNELAVELQNTMGSNFIDEPEDLADYGLAPVRFMITVTDDDRGEPQTIFYGNIDVLSEKGGIYTMRDDRPDLFVTPAHLLTLLPGKPDSWREKHVLTAQENPIHRIEYRNGDDAFILELDSDRGWQVVEPAIEDVDQLAISSFIASLKTITISHFLDDAKPGDYNLDAPQITINVFTEGEETPRVILMAPAPDNPDYYAALQDGGGVTLVHKNMAQRAFAKAADFRSKTLLAFTREMAERMDFTLDGVQYVFEKVHGRWLVRKPEGKVLANQSDATKLLELMSPLRARGALLEWKDDPAVYGLDDPVFRFEVLVRNPANPAESTVLGPVEVGSLTEDDLARRYARAKGRDGLFQLPQDLIDSLREIVLGVVDS